MQPRSLPPPLAGTRTRFLTTLTLTVLCLVRVAMAVPQPHPYGDGPPEKTLSPFFKVVGGDPNVEAFPLKSTDVKASIAGVIADVQVEQVYTNTGKQPIEATYIFPASTRAAVHGVEMHIGGRVIKSKVQEKQQAKATYEKAKSENKTASLLEEHRPNVFQMSVANIQPGDEVRVILHYSEKLPATNHVHEFVFPTVVGPRYSNQGTQTEKWVQNPYLSEGTPNPTTFAMQVNVRAGMPLQSLASPSHDTAEVKFTGKDQATVNLATGKDTGNRDFVLRYQLAGQQVASGLLLHKGEKENFFLLNMQPPTRVQPAEVPPRDYLFVVDVSGSMGGFPMDTSKELMRGLLKGLRPQDTFNVLLFAAGSDVMASTSQPANKTNVDRAIKFVDRQSGGGGTELLAALKRALALPQAEGVSRSIIVLTDGYVDIEKETFRLVRRELGKANVFTFGIGTSVNRWLIEGLAHAGMGEPYVVLNKEEAPEAAKRFQEYVSTPLLTDIQVRYEGFDAQQSQPETVPDIFANRAIELIGKWQGEPKGRIIVKGKSGGAPYEATFDVATEAAKGLDNPALRPLWAREKVRTLADEGAIASNQRGGGTDDEAAKEIANLGVTYELLTEYTSFVGVDETPRAVLASADAQTVQQPLPLPQGVGNGAVGGGGGQPVVIAANGGTVTGAVPEPATTLLLFLALAAVLFHRHRELSGKPRIV
ncbi:VIT and VWA domain-containing protein [Roseimicrobium sp. ORNL1]|uniref:VIT and vWA domain-containing protein n=1 Tax=Roseimicrobium sp. ORNL1 TaxID=2711231 RepID=UPI0013E1C205|nr:VIT and VWA domain-containing protein [Roseimicrobium sp. ORNL1]QIF02997.1 VWA domain-containing protein [Roseimicrobium sp. ORNL1]